MYVWLKFHNNIIYILMFNLPIYIDLLCGHHSHAIMILSTAIITISLPRIPEVRSSLSLSLSRPIFDIAL